MKMEWVLGIEPNEHSGFAFKLPFSGRGPTYLHA